MSVAPKITAFAAIIRVLIQAMGPLREQWVPLLIVLSVLTMGLGNLVAISQRSVKRMLAYSSIAHAGTILIGIVAANELGRQGVMVYSLSYLLMSLGAFAVVIAVSRACGSDDLSAVRGLARERLSLALLMVVFLLSLSGIPPFLGFWGKFFVFAAAVQAKLYWLALAGLVNTLFAVYYYFRVARAMFFEERSVDRVWSDREWSLDSAILFAAAALLVLGFFPGPVLSLVQASVWGLP
jgi:NADH-quinone oxidoreductase subunit N